MKNTLTIIGLFVCLVLLQNCKKDTSNSNITTGCTNGSANFSFLANGHKIKFYYADITGQEDTVLLDFFSTNDPSKYEIKATSQTGSAVGSIGNSFYHACEKDFYSSFDGNYNQLGHWWISLDANIGDKWTRQNGTSTYNYQLVSKNASITSNYSGLTHSNCYKFTYNQVGSFNVDTIYFKPDLGIAYYDGFSAMYETVWKNW